MPPPLTTSFLALGLILVLAGYATGGVLVAIAAVAWQVFVTFGSDG